MCVQVSVGVSEWAGVGLAGDLSGTPGEDASREARALANRVPQRRDTAIDTAIGRETDADRQTAQRRDTAIGRETDADRQTV